MEVKIQMKYELYRFLFSWLNTPLQYLTPMQILTMISEFIIVMLIVSKFLKFTGKGKNNGQHKTNENKRYKDIRRF